METKIRLQKFFTDAGVLSRRACEAEILAGNVTVNGSRAGPGKYGHVAIRTNFVDRAIAYLNRIGVAIDASSITYDAKGKPKFAYLRDEIAGFAFHLIQK